MAVSDPSNEESEQKIKEYLLANPDFFLRHDELLNALKLPEEWAEIDNVVDFRSALIANLQNQLNIRDAENRELFSIARVNHAYQQNIHHLVLKMVACETQQDLLNMLTHTMPKQLEVEKITLCLVPQADTEPLLQNIMGDNLRLISGKILHLLGGEHVLQRKHIEGEPEIYGTKNYDAGQIHSDLLIAIDLYGCRGFMAFGACAPEQFDQTLEADYMIFLTNIFVQMLTLLHRFE